MMQLQALSYWAGCNILIHKYFIRSAGCMVLG